MQQSVLSRWTALRHAALQWSQGSAKRAENPRFKPRFNQKQ
jgi:hypothetical protein